MPIFVRTSFAASDWPSASSAFISRWCALRYAGLVSTAPRTLQRLLVLAGEEEGLRTVGKRNRRRLVRCFRPFLTAIRQHQRAGRVWDLEEVQKVVPKDILCLDEPPLR